MPNEKVLLAIYDADLKCRTVKKYEVSDSGTQIKVKSGGDGHFMPTFDNESFLELPTRKRFIFFGGQLWKRFYFVKKKGEKCVNFQTPKAFGPNPEDAKKAIGSTLLEQVGKNKPENTLIAYATLGLLVLVFLKLLEVF